MIASYTFAAESISTLHTELKKALENIEFKPSLAFAFVSVHLPITQIMDAFKAQDILLFGATSGGGLLFDKKGDVLMEKGAVFVLTDMNPAAFSLHFLKRNDKTSLEFGEQIGKKAMDSFPHPSVILATSGMSLDGQALVDGILELTAKDLVMYGGMAADEGRFQKTFVFTETFISEDGAILLVLDSQKIELSGMATSGWVGLGSEFVVSRSEGNVVYEINGQPALDFYTDYLSVSEDDLPGIGLEYPFMLKTEDNVEIIRAVTQVNSEKRALVFAGSLPQGSIISFSTSPGFEILEDTREKIIDFHSRHQQVDLLLLFSCVARHIALGPLITTEIKLASIKWKVPLLGFFTFGEYGNNENNFCRFYNQTFTLALLRDKT